MDLNCSYKFAKENQPTITVGDVFEAHCQLPAGVSVDVQKLEVKQVDPKQKTYDLAVVKSALGGDHLGMALTSYIVGPKELTGVIVTDGTQEFTIQPPIKFEVQSILKPDQKPEMFGPMSVGIVIPLFYWVLLASILVVLVFSSLVGFIRSRKRKKLLKRLELLDDGSQPVQQFFANYRKLQRENIIFSSRSQTIAGPAEEPAQSSEELLKLIKAVESSLRVFIARRFRIANFEFSWKAILTELNKYHDFFYSVMGAELVELSLEFRKAGIIGKNRIEGKDAMSISEKTRRWVEKADQLEAAIKSNDTQLIKKLRGAR